MDWFSNQNVVIQTLIATSFTYLLTALGASVVFFFKKINKSVLDIMMGLAAGIMIAASFWSLLMPAITLCVDLGRVGYLEPALGFLLGGLFVVGSDIYLSRKTKINSEKKNNILLVTSITLHNIPEGMAVGVAMASVVLLPESINIMGAIMLAVGIGIQNFPEGVCVVGPLRKNGMSRKNAFLVGQFSGFVEIIAGLIGVLFALAIRNILPLVLSFSAGAMIAVVCSELIPDAFEDNKTLASIGVITGFIIMMVFDVAFS